MSTEDAADATAGGDTRRAGFVRVESLGKTYAGSTEPVFEHVSFDIAQGEFVCIVGHSGCGKTTILNVLAGLETASDGHVIMAGREISGPSLERGVVFQGHALMPWLTVRSNIAFAGRSKWLDWNSRRSMRRSRSTWNWSGSVRRSTRNRRRSPEA